MNIWQRLSFIQQYNHISVYCYCSIITVTAVLNTGDAFSGYKFSIHCYASSLDYIGVFATCFNEGRDLTTMSTSGYFNKMLFNVDYYLYIW